MPNWNDVLKEIVTLRNNSVEQGRLAVDATRRKYLLKLFGHTSRNIIAYYSGFLSKPGIAQLDIGENLGVKATLYTSQKDGKRIFATLENTGQRFTSKCLHPSQHFLD